MPTVNSHVCLVCKMMTAPLLASLFLASPTAPALRPINLTDLSLSPHDGDGGASFFASAEALNSVYLHWLDLDRLLVGFRTVGGVPPPNGTIPSPYGGWCAGVDSCAWLGHLLSALAFATASQKDAGLRTRSEYIIGVLSQVSRGVAKRRPEHAGWLGPAEWQDPPAGECHDSEGLYGSHKLIAGLIDQFEQTGDARAKALALGLAAPSSLEGGVSLPPHASATRRKQHERRIETSLAAR